MMTRLASATMLFLVFLVYACSDATGPATLETPPDPKATHQPGHVIRIAAIGANSGNRASSQICSSGDLACTVTFVSAGGFNALSPSQLRATYDVLIFTWNSSSAINADWNTRLLPYMALGGGIIFEDPNNVGDLSPGISGFPAGGGFPWTISATVPGLTDGINGSFVNQHIIFTSWDPALSPFITDSSGFTVGLFGAFSGGCIVATGPDQDFHASRGAGDPAGNQYNLLINEIRWVSGGGGDGSGGGDEGDDEDSGFDDFPTGACAGGGEDPADDNDDGDDDDRRRRRR